MTRTLVVLCALLLLGGCVTVPLATTLAVAGASAAVGSFAVNAIHNCRADGGCRDLPVPGAK